MSKKKSDFTGSSTVPSGSTFDYVYQGTNYKISEADLASALGLTGSITTTGNVLGTPVLNTSGSTNYIRNLENGAGVKADLSPENGITLAHNFTVDSVGVPGMFNPTQLSPTLPSFVAGSGLSISRVDDHILFTATEISAPTTTAVILQKSDLPAPSGGVISLNANTNYVLGNNIDLGTDRLDVSAGNISWSSGNLFGPTLTYQGTGNLFSGGNFGTFHIFNARINAPNGQVFSFTDSPANTSLFLGDGVIITSCDKIGTMNSLLSCVCTGTFSAFSANDGMTLTGTGWRVWRFEEFGTISTDASCIQFNIGTAQAALVNFDTILFNAPAGATCLSGTTASGNVATGSIGNFAQANIIGGAATLANITTDDVRWEFVGNNLIPDTRPDALISIESNATETVIAATDTPVKVAGTWTVEDDSHFTGDSTGRVTYNGDRDFTAPIDYSSTFLMATGSAKDITVYIAVNGSVVTATGKGANVSSSAAASITGAWQHTFSTGDYVELWVENNSDTTNIVCQQSVGRIN